MKPVVMIAPLAAALAVAACETQPAGSEDGRAQHEERVGPPPPPPPQEMAAAAPQGVVVTGARLSRPPVPPPPQPMPGDVERDDYEDFEPNPVKLVSEEPVSTFAMEADTASYAVIRSYLDDGRLPPKDAVRAEEVINYFDYDWPLPDSRERPFEPSVAIAPSPWRDGADLMVIGIKGFDTPREARPPVNLTFLVDVSGSMSAEDKLPLAKQALRLLAERLGPQDRISMVVYSGAAGEVLPPTPGDESRAILGAIDSLEAGGSTAGGEGMRLAYALAERSFDEDAVNRVIMMTDGDFNVGVSDTETLQDFVERKRETGIYLSVFGFGRGNYQDARMQAIAQHGNGTAAYIDTLREARKVMHDEMSGTLFPIADDVKIQVEFNPARVAEYRLIGYETRMLAREDFANDQVDAGEIGSGHAVTAIYEIVAPDSPARLIEPLRYGGGGTEVSGDPSGEIAHLRLRYKLPGEDDSRLIERPVTTPDSYDTLDAAPQPVRFAVAAAGYAQLLKGDPRLSAGYGYDDVIALAQEARGEDEFGYRAEFVQLARAAQGAAALPELDSPGRGQ